MNQGGEPGHDDDGLPQVDIEIPDDARELYRDVQAYHRELRALRRQQRSYRLRAPLRRSGIILPLVAGCLLLALISAMVLTMFSADPYFARSASPGRTGAPVRHGRTGAGSGSARQPASPARSASVSPSAGSASAGPAQSAAPLPGRTISVAGKQVALSTLTSTALAIVPAHCGCAIAVRQLLTQAEQAKVAIYLVGPRGSTAELARLAATGAAGNALVATDAADVLGSAYRTTGLSVLLVDSHGLVRIALDLRPGLDLEQQLVMLRSAS